MKTYLATYIHTDQRGTVIRTAEISGRNGMWELLQLGITLPDGAWVTPYAIMRIEEKL
jgi:hypothetical protein